ncbi:magnesium transporter [Microbacterium sediminicola]|uniref:Magnesium transporter MgtE n=1 Tax=Microbacterium sediminicola TaxID=415210 RepID=A0ABN2I7C3_9MICO
MDDFEDFRTTITPLLKERRLDTLRALLDAEDAAEIVQLLEREDAGDRAVLYRLLQRDKALEVFELLDQGMRAELVGGLREEDVQRVFEELDPDDRAQLIDELPAKVAKYLMRGLSPAERELTAPMLGYDKNSTGRFMSTEYVLLAPGWTLGDALSHVRHRGMDAETVYTLPVTSERREVLGVVGLRELVMGRSDSLVEEVMTDARSAVASEPAEASARDLVESGHLAAPVVDSQNRILGILTIDDATRILEEAEDRDAARQGASEPLGRPYLTTPVFGIVKSRVVWLLVLAVSALLTVQVLDIFEATLEQVVTLALFIPLLTGTAGNTGSQAATTVTRALAMGEVSKRDALTVMWREVRVGAILGGLLGILGFALASLVFGPPLGAVIGLTLLSICTLAATVGGLMPILAQAVKADPAVFSTPFISTFCDATSLIIYFVVATWILGL